MKWSRFAFGPPPARSPLLTTRYFSAPTLPALRLALRFLAKSPGFTAIAGTALAFAASRSLAALLYATPEFDVLAYLAAALAMTLACLAAALIPARRTTRVDPLVALCSEQIFLFPLSLHLSPFDETFFLFSGS